MFLKEQGFKLPWGATMFLGEKSEQFKFFLLKDMIIP